LQEVLQRQAQSEAPATSDGQQQGQASQAEKKNQGEPDLQDLAQKVYAEVRRRLNVESERTRRYF
jgi:hypothetical protein